MPPKGTRCPQNHYFTYLTTPPRTQYTIDHNVYCYSPHWLVHTDSLLGLFSMTADGLTHSRSDARYSTSAALAETEASNVTLSNQVQQNANQLHNAATDAARTAEVRPSPLVHIHLAIELIRVNN